MGLVEDAYGARRAAQVMEDTWGHLRPDAGRHEGYLVAAFAAYGGAKPLITAEFDDVPDSPWLYEAMCDLVEEAEMETGCVYRFAGALVQDGKELWFEGQWAKVSLDGN